MWKLAYGGLDSRLRFSRSKIRASAFWFEHSADGLMLRLPRVVFRAPAEFTMHFIVYELLECGAGVHCLCSGSFKP